GIDRATAYGIALEAGPVEAVTFRFRGHPGVRASHVKTLEFKRSGDVSPRETCVLGTDADWDPAAVKALRGRVRVTVEVGDAAESFEASVCPACQSAERMVFRRSRHPSPETLGTDATLGAAGLSRDLVERLREGCEGRVPLAPAE